jgi:hypothetical protein
MDGWMDGWMDGYRGNPRERAGLAKPPRLIHPVEWLKAGKRSDAELYELKSGPAGWAGTALAGRAVSGNISSKWLLGQTVKAVILALRKLVDWK